MKRTTGWSSYGPMLIGVVSMWLLPAAADHAADSDPPHVLFILADDLGWRDLSLTGSSFYETPHIDRIGKSGVRFVQGYAACQVCSPSRAAIMTGRYPARLHLTDWIGAATGYDWNRNDRLLPPDYEHHLPHENVTIAEAFQQAGYATFFAGKWHLGGDGSLPQDHGFDMNRGGWQAGSPVGGYFSPYRNPQLEDGPPGESLPLRLARETADFIRSHHDRPFFAFLSFYSVHAPIQTGRERWQRYRDRAVTRPRPKERFVIDRTLPVRQVQDCPVYAGMIEAMDDAVGLVLQTLDDLNLTDRTVIVFTSDNGGVSSGDAYATSNLPLRGGKGRQWEGGIREPYFIAGPGIASGTCRTPVTGTDFYPTLLELCGLPLRPEQHLDGRSLLPLLTGTGSFPERDLFWHYPHYGNQGGEPSSIIRRGPWKLIHYWEDGRRELYHLESDPSERKNVASSHPQLTATLGTALNAWLQNVDAAVPEPDPRFDPQKHAQRQRHIRDVLKPRLEKQHARMLEADYRPNPTWWGSLVTSD